MRSHIAVLGLLCMAQAAGAGEMGAACFTQTEPSNNTTPPLRLVYDDSRAAVNPGMDGALYAQLDDKTIHIFDAQNNELVDLVAMRKAAEMAGLIAPKDRKALVDGVDQVNSVMEHQIQKILDTLPADQRALAEPMLRRQMGLPPKGNAAPPEGKLEAEFTGDADVIAGVGVERIILTKGGTPVREFWGADPAALPGGADFVTANAKLDVLYHEITEGIPNAEDRSFMSDIHLVKRIPIRVRMVTGNTVWERDAACAPPHPGELALPDLPIRTRPF